MAEMSSWSLNPHHTDRCVEVTSYGGMWMDQVFQPRPEPKPGHITALQDQDWETCGMGQRIARLPFNSILEDFTKHFAGYKYCC